MALPILRMEQNASMIQTQQPPLTRSVFRAGLLLAGCLMLLAGLLATLIVVGMFVQPGGMGAEKLLGPVGAFFALVLFVGGGISLYLGFRVKT
jgi:hypothetical protein